MNGLQVLNSEMKKMPLLSSGLGLINLASSGMLKGFLRKGCYFHFVGDSSTGKSIMAMQIIAEAIRSGDYDDYEFHYIDAENGALPYEDIVKFFGQATADKVIVHHMTYVEDIYDFLDDLYKAKKKHITIVDSMDSLSCKADEKKFQDNKTARKKGTKETGSFGVEKARINSQNLRILASTKLRKTQSILTVISQTRDNIGFGFETKTRSGGKALHFYAHLSIWTSLVKTLKKNVNGQDRVIGANICFEIKKNRISGRYCKVIIPFYFQYGFDDTGSCIQYLLDEKHWKKSGGKIDAKELGLKMGISKLAAVIEEKEMVPDLRKIVKKVWKQIESELKIGRAPRYQ